MTTTPSRYKSTTITRSCAASESDRPAVNVAWHRSQTRSATIEVHPLIWRLLGYLKNNPYNAFRSKPKAESAETFQDLGKHELYYSEKITTSGNPQFRTPVYPKTSDVKVIRLWRIKPNVTVDRASSPPLLTTTRGTPLSSVVWKTQFQKRAMAHEHSLAKIRSDYL